MHTGSLRWATLILLLLLGCEPAKPPDAIGQIGRATGVADLVQFRREAEAIDAADDTAGALRLADAVERAFQHDADLQAALARVQSALAETDQARLLPNPVLSVALRFPDSGAGKPVIEAGLAADLLSLLQKPGRISAADNRLRAASSEALKTALDLLAEVQERYASVQSLDAQLLVLEERRALIARLVQQARARLEAGESGRLDMLTLDAERVGIEADIIERTAERTDERLKLTRLIGQPSAQIGWAILPWEAKGIVSLPESSWISSALKNRPEIQVARWELAALGDDVAVAGLSFIDGADVGIDAERDGPWTIGPAISTPIPFLDWGQAGRAKAEANQIEARHKLVQAQRQVIEEVRRATAALAAAQRALAKVRDELIPLQESRREQAEAQYKNGFADINAVLLAEQDAKSARLSLIQLQQKASVASLRLERAVGGPGVVEQTEMVKP